MQAVTVVTATGGMSTAELAPAGEERGTLAVVAKVDTLPAAAAAAAMLAERRANSHKP
jgi:hypothetical protein